MRRLALLTVSGPLLLSLAFAQQPAATPQQNQAQAPKTVPLPHLYWHFLMWQNHLDSAAAEHEKAGRDGAWLRTYVEKRLGFSDAEFAPVRESAQRLQATIAGLDSQAMVIVQKDRAMYAKGLLAASDSPPGLPRLRELTQERETAISDEIAQLNAALGPVNSARLRSFIEKSFSTNVKAVPIQPVLHPPSQPGSASLRNGVQP
jgi:hypothetical protein